MLISDQEMVSARGACRILASAGVTRNQALKVLATGLAGPSADASWTVLYEAAKVRALTQWPVLPLAELPGLGLPALFVARRPVDLSAPRADQLEGLRGGWGLGFWSSVFLGVDAVHIGPIPLIATVGGFVVAGANLVGCGLDLLTLEEPGPWFGLFQERRVQTGPGNAWWFRGWHPEGFFDRDHGRIAR